MTAIWAFLGLAGYFYRYIKHFAKIAAPLYSLCEQHLTTSPVLVFPDCFLPFQLQTDASLLGLRAVLSQKQEGVEKRIACGCESLKPALCNPLNYSSFRLELLAVMWSVAKTFAKYLTNK